MIEQSDISSVIEKVNEEFKEDEKFKEHFLKISNFEGDVEIDSKLHINLYSDNVHLGTAGVSLGLDDYYSKLFLYNLEREKTEYDTDKYQHVVENMKNKWIITQMQASSKPVSRIVRGQVNFRKYLVKAWEKIFEEFNEKLDYYLPGDLVFWNIDVVRKASVPLELGEITQNCLKINYDCTARRHKFKFNSEIGVYAKN